MRRIVETLDALLRGAYKFGTVVLATVVVISLWDAKTPDGDAMLFTRLCAVVAVLAMVVLGLREKKKDGGVRVPDDFLETVAARDAALVRCIEHLKYCASISDVAGVIKFLERAEDLAKPFPLPKEEKR